MCLSCHKLYRGRKRIHGVIAVKKRANLNILVGSRTYLKGCQPKGRALVLSQNSDSDLDQK